MEDTNTQSPVAFSECKAITAEPLFYGHFLGRSPSLRSKHCASCFIKVQYVHLLRLSAAKFLEWDERVVLQKRFYCIQS